MNIIANITFPKKVIDFIDSLVKQDWRCRNRAETIRTLTIERLDELYPDWDKKKE